MVRSIARTAGALGVEGFAHLQVLCTICVKVGAFGAKWEDLRSRRWVWSSPIFPEEGRMVTTRVGAVGEGDGVVVRDRLGVAILGAGRIWASVCGTSRMKHTHGTCQVLLYAALRGVSEPVVVGTLGVMVGVYQQNFRLHHLHQPCILTQATSNLHP